MKYAIALVAASAAIISALFFGIPAAQATGCQGYNGAFISSGTCTDDYYDGGYGQTCTSFSVFGFYSFQCTPNGPPPAL